MGYNQKATGRAMSMPAGLAVGWGISMAVTLCSAGILSTLLGREILTWDQLGYGIMVLLILSSFLGALTACSKIKHQILMVSGLSGFVYFCSMLAMTALFFGGQYDAVGVTAVLVMGSGISAGLLRIWASESGQGRRPASRAVKLNKIRK